MRINNQCIDAIDACGVDILVHLIYSRKMPGLSMLHLIKEIKEVRPFRIKLKFNTGEIKTSTWKEILKNLEF